MERRDHAPIGWEEEEEGASSSPPAVIEEQEQRTTVQSEAFGTTLPTVILPSPQVISSQTTWESNANHQQANSLQQSRIVSLYFHYPVLIIM